MNFVILYRTENFVERVQAITGGRGADVAYDSVGKDTFLGSMTCLARLGHMVNFGQAYRFEDVGRAQQDMEDRKTAGR